MKVSHSCPTLYDPMDCSPPSFSVHGILQARIGWSGLPLSFPGDLPDPGIEPRSPVLQADSLLPEPPGKPSMAYKTYQNLAPAEITPPRLLFRQPEPLLDQTPCNFSQAVLSAANVTMICFTIS